MGGRGDRANARDWQRVHEKSNDERRREGGGDNEALDFRGRWMLRARRLWTEHAMYTVWQLYETSLCSAALTSALATPVPCAEG